MHLLHSRYASSFLVFLAGWISSTGGLNSSQYSHAQCVCNCKHPSSEMNALYDLYHGTNGENWLWNDDFAYGIPWNFSDPVLNKPCEDHWQGINCSYGSSLNDLHVTQVSLPSYNLVGGLPDTLDALTMLQTLDLLVNHITGTIPKTLCNLAHLQRLNFNSNAFVDSIPECLANLATLQLLDLSGNYLFNTIPVSLGNLTQLRSLYLNYNQLNGTVPLSLSNLIQLQYLELESNRLTGSIPKGLSELTQLLVLELENNRLTGTIPESFGNLVQLQFLYLFDNQLTGSVPETLGNLAQLRYLLLYKNKLVGTLPESLGNLSQLQYLLLYENRLTGTIPESLGSLTQLQYLDLDTNHLTGSIPVALGALMQLQYVRLDTNHLTGTIPYFANSNLEQLLLFNNHLRGAVPSLSRAESLQVILLQNNQLSGSLDIIFDPTSQHQIKTLVFANNQLTGTLPEALFQLNLETFVGTSNCFEGPLPVAAICGNMNMISFVIDGMSSASSCRSKLLTQPFSAYVLEHSVGGSIPTCIFQLPNIATLHLSGNGFTGSLPGDLVLSGTLTDLALSHNALTGVIPDQVQLKRWNNIDLSYNRLAGTLHSDFAANGSIDLEYNRISGSIPASFRSLENLSILGSNTFSCNYDQSNLPEHDPNKGKYQCGSNSFDVLFYTWLGAVVLSATVFCCYERKYRAIQTMLSSDIMLHNSNLYTTLRVLYYVVFGCALYSIVVLLPLYAACSVSYGTQTHAYAYQISAVYISGVVPFALDWCFWSIWLFGFSAIVLYAPSFPSCTSSQQLKRITYSHTMSTIVPYLLIDIIVVAGVNAAYVYVAVYKSSSLLLLLQTLLSIFKVVWGRAALPYFLNVLTRGKEENKVHLYTQIFVNLLNNIAIPYLIVAVVSPDCFYNALVAAPTVSAIVYYRDCAVVDTSTGLCYKYRNEPVSTSFTPPFTYNYQCSSSLITYYSPAFVSMCIVNTFLLPLVQYVFEILHSRAESGTLWYRLWSKCIPGTTQSAQGTSGQHQSYLYTDRLMTTLIGTLGLILTFGVMFPPLCIAFVVSISATVFYFRNNVGRIIQDPTLQQIDSIVEVIRAECSSVDAMHILKGSVWLLITVSCWFYTLFLFDTLGDAVGFERAYWVLIVMPLMPLVLYVLYTVVRKYYAFPLPQHFDGDKPHDSQTSKVEMHSISSNEADVKNILVVGTAVDTDDVADSV